MKEQTIKQLRQLSDTALAGYASALHKWLREASGDIVESRAKALLRLTNVLDDPTLHDFAARMGQPAAVRVALADLLDSADIQEAPLVLGSAESPPASAIDWLSLTMTAYAHKIGYPLDELDPASPPTQFSPAGQVVHQAGAWVRRQVQRSATERDKAARRLAYDGSQPVASAATPPAAAPAPSAIPVRHFEFNDPVAVAETELDMPMPPIVERGAPLTITVDDVTPTEPAPASADNLDIKIGESRRVPRSAESTAATTASSVRQALSENLPEIRDSVVSIANSLATSVRSKFKSEPMQTARLRIVVKEHPNGPGLPAVQVRLGAQGVKGTVAGTTSSNGTFTVEVPVRSRNGLTYSADVTWPQQMGGKTERKLITLNTYRDEFQLIFYHRLR